MFIASVFLLGFIHEVLIFVQFGFSSMGYSLLLVSEFDHEAYGLSFKTVAM